MTNVRISFHYFKVILVTFRLLSPSPVITFSESGNRETTEGNETTGGLFKQAEKIKYLDNFFILFVVSLVCVKN